MGHAPVLGSARLPVHPSVTPRSLLLSATQKFALAQTGVFFSAETPEPVASVILSAPSRLRFRARRERERFLFFFCRHLGSIPAVPAETRDRGTDRGTDRRSLDMRELVFKACTVSVWERVRPPPLDPPVCLCFVCVHFLPSPGYGSLTEPVVCGWVGPSI